MYQFYKIDGVWDINSEVERPGDDLPSPWGSSLWFKYHFTTGRAWEQEGALIAIFAAAQ
jgi:hypothetical protein